MCAQAGGARLERIYTAIAPHEQTLIRAAFGHPALTFLQPEERAQAAYALANKCCSVWAAKKAIEFADSLLLKSTTPYTQHICNVWGSDCSAAWAPAANWRPVSSVVKALKKGTPTQPASVRYVDNQLARAAKEGPTTATNKLYLDVTRAWALKTFGDPRPVVFSERKALLTAEPSFLYTNYVASKRPSFYFGLLNNFVSGVAQADSTLKWALKRHATGFATPLATHSYTSIVRRVLTPKTKHNTPPLGIPAGAISASSSSILRAVTAGGTSKRVKAALQSLSTKEKQIITSYITAPYPLGRVPLHADEARRQDTLPQSLALWCAHCRHWVFKAAAVVDLSVPGVGFCSTCSTQLRPVQLNGHCIGEHRLCSQCGQLITSRSHSHLHGTSVICTDCAASNGEESRPCVVCSAVAHSFVMASGKDKYEEVWLCTTHHPGNRLFDIYTPVETVLQYL